MHRLLRDIAAGVQTLRFLTALVCSAAVTTAVAGPMAYQALSFDPQAAVLGTASNTTRSDRPDPTASLPRLATTGSTASSSIATTAPTTATTLPATTAPPPSMAAATVPETTPPTAASTTPTAPDTFVTSPVEVFEPPPSTVANPTTTVPPSTGPTVVPPPTSIVRPTPMPFDVRPNCDEGKAVELDENVQGECADKPEGQ